MIYLVSKALFGSDKYTLCSIEESLKILDKMKVVGVDTETEGFDVFSKRLLTIQMGNYEDQVVVDCRTINPLAYKEFLESKDRMFLFWNAKFDLKFLYHKNILVNNVYDGYLAEKLFWLGYPAGMHGLSLADAGNNYLNVELDKSIRGQIISKGLTEEVIEYAANDVKYLEKIKEKQEKLLLDQDLLDAVSIENEFVKCLAYIEYCGVRLDIARWKKKMQKDQNNLDQSLNKLNKWVSESMPQSEFVSIDRQGDLFEGFDLSPKCNINWNSPKQVASLLTTLGFDLMVEDKDTGEMKMSVDSKVIESQKGISSIAPIYIEFKGYQKLVSTYGQNFLDSINKITGRIHTNFTQLMDTGRLSCGGKNKKTKEEYVNLQNLPSDPETRACFIPKDGNTWISADYKGQESVIIADISGDKAMIKEFLEGSGDIHSLVCKMSYPNIVEDCPVKEIKSKFKHWRDEAKGVEFAVNYGGDFNTIANNKNIPIQEAKIIYDNYMKGFPSIKSYQDFCRKDVMNKGFILLNPLTRHKAYIYDFKILKGIQDRIYSDPTFWQTYKLYKESKKQKKKIPNPVLMQLCERFANGEPYESLTGIYEYKIGSDRKVATYTIKIEDVYLEPVRRFFKRKSASEKQSINYRIQGTGALCFKLASIKLFNYLKEKGYLFKVLYCIPVHDKQEFVVYKPC